MKLTGLVLVRNEEWALGLTLRAALLWCDEVVVFDHASTDQTPQIIAEVAAEHPRRVTVLRSSEPDWRESVFRQATLEAARAHGATHLAIVDGDEILTGNLLPVVREHVGRLGPGGTIAYPMVGCWRSTSVYRADGSVWSRSWVCSMFTDHPQVEWAARPDGYEHHARFPGRTSRKWMMPVRPHDGGVIHLQFASWRRLLAKHVWYRMMETVRWPGRWTPEQLNATYDEALDETKLATRPVPDEWWAPYREHSWLEHLHLDHESWHEAECRRLYAEHGAAAFAGLDLKGLAGEGAGGHA